MVGEVLRDRANERTKVPAVADSDEVRCGRPGFVNAHRKQQHVSIENSGIWSAQVLSQVLLAPIAGLTVSVAGYARALVFNVVTFAASAFFLVGLYCETRRNHSGGLGIFHQSRIIVGMLAKDRLLRALVVAQALAASSAGSTSVLLVILARERHRGGGTRLSSDAGRHCDRGV